MFVALGSFMSLMGPSPDATDRFFFAVSAGGLVLLILNSNHFLQGTLQCSTL